MRFVGRNCIFALVLVCTYSFAAESRPERHFPDINGFKTLVCDLHTHTIFSDGKVWPFVRVEEAYREGIDVLAITDHIEHHRFKDDVRTNPDRPHEIALPLSQELDILLIKGGEISKETPPGHYNAIMVTDVNQIHRDNLLDAARIASEQGGFVTWNHHAWKGEEKGKWEDIQNQMYKNNWLNGMEVANGSGYYPLAHQWCLDKNLTMLGNSDIHHTSIEYKYTADEHRTLTLVFAEDRTLESVRQALFARRTAVWFQNSLIGPVEQLRGVYNAAVTVYPVHFRRGPMACFKISNNALIDLKLTRSGKTGPWRINIPAKSSIIESVELNDEKNVTLDYTVENMLIAPNTGLPVKIDIRMP